MARIYPPEFRERALRLLAEVRSDYSSDWAAFTYVAGKLGVNLEMLRNWTRAAQIGAGVSPGLPPSPSKQLCEDCRRRMILITVPVEIYHGRKNQTTNTYSMVEHRRFELLTSSMRTKRATNCANAPDPARLPRNIKLPQPTAKPSGVQNFKMEREWLIRHGGAAGRRRGCSARHASFRVSRACAASGSS